MAGHVTGQRSGVYTIDAGALMRELAELACPVCEHPIGLHTLGGPCQACSCNGVISCAVIEPEPDQAGVYRLPPL